MDHHNTERNMPENSFERMSMLDGPDVDNVRGLYANLRKRLNRFAWVAGITITIMLLILSLSLLRFHSSIASLQASLTHTNSQILTSKPSIDDVANGTFGFGDILVISLPERTDHRDGLILASAVSGIDVTFVDGVRRNTISDKAFPPGYNKKIQPGQIGAWRAHMNAIDQVVKRGLSTALIMEDDVDWDVRIKEILKNYALSSNGLIRSDDGTTISFSRLETDPQTNTSPYGDGWDVLWLGHCGMKLKTGESRVVHANDITVPEPQYLHSWDPNEKTPLSIYPNHTRISMPLSDGVCSLAYAVSQKGARSILNSIGLEKLDNAFDLMLRDFCVGSDEREKHKCFSVLPQIFDHHRKKGSGNGDSDIIDHSDTNREKALTLNIRWSVRMNMARILRGETTYEDQYPDTDTG